MRTLIGLMVMLIFAGSIPFLWGDPGVEGERGDPLMGAPPAKGNTIIVDINGNGDYTSIQDAIDNSQPGDMVRIWDGTYSGRVYVKSGIYVIGNHSKTLLRLGGELCPFIILSNATIQNLDISNSYTNGECIRVYGDDVRIDNCVVHGPGGIKLQLSDRTIISSVRFDNCSFPVDTSACNSLTLNENIAVNNEKWGIFRFDTRGLKMYNNKLFNCSIFFWNDPIIFQNNDIPINNTINSISILFVSEQKDVKIDNIYSQMFFNKCGSVTITKSKMSGVCRGMMFFNCDEIKIDNSSFQNLSSGHGSITIDNSKNIILNHIYSDEQIRIDRSDKLNIRDINLYSANLDISVVKSVELYDNRFEWGHVSITQLQSVLSVNLISSNVFNRTSTEVSEASSFLVYDNEFDNSSVSMHRSNFSMSDNIFRRGGIRIYDNTNDHGCVENCVFYHPYEGIEASDTTGITIENVTMMDGKIGIEFLRSSGYIANSTIMGNNMTGISLDNVTKTTIVNNDINANGIGIYCLNTKTNKIYNNRFNNNEKNAVSENGNDIWNKVPPIGGNYWSDFIGMDQKRGNAQDEPGSDGFGDTSYRISGSETDRYPIVIDRTPPHAEFTNISAVESNEFTLSTINCYDDNLVTKADWSFDVEGELINKTGLTVRMTVDKPCEVKVILNVSDFAGNYDIAEGKITVFDMFDPMAICGGNISCIEGSTIYFDASGSTDSGEISKYEWTFNYKGSTVFLNGINVSYFFDKPDIIQVTLKVTDSAGHYDETNFVLTVIDVTKPSVDAGPDKEIDNEEVALFNATLSTDNGSIREYNWTFEYGGQSILLQDIISQYKFDIPGHYNITLTVTDMFGNKASDLLVLTVRDTKDPKAVINGLATFIENENIKLSGKNSIDNGRIVKYLWTFGDNGTVSITGIDLDYKVKVRGYHTVFLTVFDEWGNNASANLTVNAIDGNKPFASAGPDRIVALGSIITFNASKSHDDGTIVKYEWSFTYDNQKEVLLGKRATFKFDKVGPYEVTLRVYDDNENYGLDTVTISVKNTGVVKGIVRDGGGKPLDKALVEIVASDGKMYTFITAPNGEFSLEIPPGSFSWKITKSGYVMITGSSSVDILGENTLDMTGTPMKKEIKTKTSPILFIVPVVILLALILGAVFFLVMRKKKTSDEGVGVVPMKEEAIPPESADGGAAAETPITPPVDSEFTQAPPIMEEDVPIENVDEKTTLDDLLGDRDPPTA